MYVYENDSLNYMKLEQVKNELKLNINVSSSGRTMNADGK